MATPENVRTTDIFPYIPLLEVIRLRVQRSFGFLHFLMSEGEMKVPPEQQQLLQCQLEGKVCLFAFLNQGVSHVKTAFWRYVYQITNLANLYVSDKIHVNYYRFFSRRYWKTPGRQGNHQAQPTQFHEGKVLLANLNSFCIKVSHLADPGKLRDVTILNFHKALDTFSQCPSGKKCPSQISRFNRWATGSWVGHEGWQRMGWHQIGASHYPMALWVYGSMILLVYDSMVPWFNGSRIPWFYDKNNRNFSHAGVCQCRLHQ